MENRKELSINTVLVLGGIEYHIEGVMGKGSCAILYKAWYKDNIVFDSRHHILIKELFPFDIKGGIYRNDNGEIEVTEEARRSFELYKQSFEKGNHVQLRILEMFPEKNGVNINTYFYNNTLYTILGFGGGHDLESELLINPNGSLLKTADRLIGVLAALDEFHKIGYYHLDISPDNILLIGNADDERTVLIDYNSVLSEKELNGDNEIFYSMKKGYTAPELRLGIKNKISRATDLYSVAAVFFRAVSGRALTEFEMLKRFPPDISGCGCICEEPETVKSLVRKILVKGLSQLPEKRYLSVSEMKKDFEELKERISGIGITHWSLWENGRKTVREMVNSNTSFGFLKDKSSIFRLNVKTDGGIRNTEEFLKDIINGAPSAVLLGDGGMGKTTSLLNIVYNTNSKYTSSAPAIVYISLYGAAPNDENYIKDKLLENLRFKSDTKTFEMARHKLKQLLRDEANLKGSPSVVVLVDGFNEISADASAIVNEIKTLSENKGIRFIITTRQYNDEFDFDKAYLVPLRDSEVQSALLKEGLLLPQNGELAELLSNPLMLSIFAEASKNGGKQLRINTKKELVTEYFSVIVNKSAGASEEDSGVFWLNDVSVNFILPAIAQESRKRKRALNDEEIFTVIKKCYKILTSKLVFRAFPKWIGHLNDILCGCKTAEVWYGITVRDVLWRKTGFLSKNESGQYRVFHQTIEEYLLDINKCNTSKVRKRLFIKNSLAAVCVLTAFLAVCASVTAVFPELAEKSVFVRLKAVSEEKAVDLLTNLSTSYVRCGQICAITSSMADNPMEYDKLLSTFEYYADFIESESNGKNAWLAQKSLEDIASEGGIMPYSYEKIGVNEGSILLSKDISDIDVYRRYAALLRYAQEDGNDEYTEAFKEFINADAEYTAVLFQYTVWKHAEKMDRNSECVKNLQDLVSMIPKTEKVRKAVLDSEKLVDSYTVTKYGENKKSAYEKMEQLYGKYEILYQGR